MKELTYHAAVCDGVFNMEGTNFKNGAGITQKWKCSCNEIFTHRNCKWIKTDIVEEGRKCSRSQPELNIHSEVSS